MSPDEVTARIADLTLQDEEDQGFKVPSRADGSQKFSLELDACVLYRKEFTRVLYREQWQLPHYCPASHKDLYALYEA